MMNVSRETLPTPTWYHRFEQGLNELNISLNDTAKSRFITYYDLLRDWNRRINLISKNDVSKIELLHFLDSLIIYSMIETLPINDVVDVGTGGGFPGLPLKIALPYLKMTLVESARKKTLFLHKFVLETGLTGIEIQHERAEKLPTSFMDRFDAAVARAVAPLDKLIPYVMPLLRQEGLFFAYKGGHLTEEIDAAADVLQQYQAEIQSIYPIELPIIKKDRKILIIRKQSIG